MKVRSCLPLPYRNYFLFGFVVMIITAWFSVGAHHPDEYYQVFEFANYKMGHTPVADLPWEFAAQCRPALQPFIVVILSKVLEILGMYNPFVVAFILRLLMGILSYWVICRWIVLLLPTFTTEKGKKLFVCCSLFLWFIPYISVRFSAENIAAQLFLLALSIITQIPKYRFRKQLLGLSIAGLLLGFACFVRIQMGFAFLGLVTWLILQKWSLNKWMIMGLFCLIAIGTCVIIDHWFYDAWIFTPFNYFNVNIIEHRAADFGVFPWWYYFSTFLKVGAPPISIVLLVLFLRGIYKKPLHILSIVCTCFLLGHFFIGHKEMRFLFPMSLPFIFLACIGLDLWLQRYPKKRFYGWVWGVLVFINSGLLLFRMITPAHEIVKNYEFIYNYCAKRNTILVSFDDMPYTLGTSTKIYFYRPHNLTIVRLKDSTELKNILNHANGQAVLLYGNVPLDSRLAGYNIKRLYCLFPEWVLKFNINNWQARSYISAVYEVSPYSLNTLRK